MSIAEKLTAIAENVQKVYEAGQNSVLMGTITELCNDSVTEIISDNLTRSNTLKLVNLPSALTIGSRVLSYCPALERVELHTVTKIGINTLMECGSLVTVIIRTGRVCELGARSLDNTPIAKGTGYIYVPRSLVEAYKTATNWSDFASQIRAIEDYPEICGTT